MRVEVITDSLRKVGFMIVGSLRKMRRLSALGLMGAIAAIAMLVGASSALATPTGEYAVFAECPYTNLAVDGCIAAKTESGKFIVGKETVPIEKAITLQGGFIENETTGELSFVGAKGGNTLTKVPQKVPGGLLGLVKCNEISNIIERIACELVFENGTTGVNATTELAAPATSIGLNETNLLEGKAPRFRFP
jgi:hypothetical protein